MHGCNKDNELKNEDETMQYQLDPEFKFKYLIDHNSNMIKKYDEYRDFEYYEVPTIEKGKVMIGVKNKIKNIIIPVLFLSGTDEEIILTNVNNNNKAMVIKTKDNSILNIREYKEGSFDIGSRCMGGSTTGCIQTALGACFSDPICGVACAATFRSCVGSITVACIIHCW